MQVLVMQPWLALLAAGCWPDSYHSMTTPVARYIVVHTLDFIYWWSDALLQ